MGKHLDPVALLTRYAGELRREALIQATFFAENYRNFRVGAAVLVTNGHDLRIFGGANIMNGKGRPKMCAEQQALKYAHLADYRRILAISVVGKPQKDSESGLLSPTLHPCPECRKLMREMYRLDEDTAIYMLSFEDNGPSELFTLEELIRLHQSHVRPRP